MQAKAGQFDAATKIEARRTTLNNYFKTTRSGHHDTDYIRTRKLSESTGIYLLNDSLDTTINKEKNAVKAILHSPFYQVVTRFLFFTKRVRIYYHST